jgi:hypothetical protein
VRECVAGGGFLAGGGDRSVRQGAVGAGGDDFAEGGRHAGFLDWDFR